MEIPRDIDRALRCSLAAGLAALCFGAAAHDFSIGDIAIAHPYATPSLPGMTTGAAYFEALGNGGSKPDKLLRATTPAAKSVELHTMSVDAQGVMRMREVDGIALAPKASVKMRPGMGMHLMLLGLKQPLKVGDSFPMSLQFEHAGKVEVEVRVQAPPPQGAMADGHGH